MEKDWIAELSGVLPQEILKRLSSLGDAQRQSLEEIRLRLGKPIELVWAEESALLPGFLLHERLSQVLLEKLCSHSVFAKERDIREGFLVLPGGYRVGLCGAYAEGRPVRVTGFNIRIARERPGCAEALLRGLMDSHGRIGSTLLISPPGAGKTTMLRDMVRACSYGLYGLKPMRVCLIDERGEIGGFGTLDLGPRTDVMEAIKRPEAMEKLLRAMGPQLIATDEIGAAADARAIRSAALCGVVILATAHGGSCRDVGMREGLVPLRGLFSNYAMLYRERGQLHYRLEEDCHARNDTALRFQPVRTVGHRRIGPAAAAAKAAP